MSVGGLVVLDRQGRVGKRYLLSTGLATLGSDPSCDIRMALGSVSAHHATLAVLPSQTEIHSMGDKETFVNNVSVGVCVLQHGDVITVGERSLRWEYSPRRQQVSSVPRAAPGGPRPSRARAPRAPAPRAPAPRAPAPRARRTASPPHADRALQLAIEMRHRASMPASAGGKQVAIVQPQRRDTSEQRSIAAPASPRLASASPRLVPASPRPVPASPRSVARRSTPEVSAHSDDKRKSRASPNTVPSNTTQATLWIESRKSTPRRVQAGAQGAPPVRRALSAKKATPLRLTVLRKAQSARKLRVVKIEAPSKIDHTKQAAIMLMTGHGSARRARGSSVTILEITDSETQSTSRGSVATRSSNSTLKSPSVLSPRKSALKDHSKKTARKTESIKFDLSNLQNLDSIRSDEESIAEEDLTLHYSSESSTQSLSPSPRKSIKNRSSRILEKLGSTVTFSPSRTLTPKSPLRRSVRGSFMVQKALDGSLDTTKTDTTVASAFRTRTLSPRNNLESYSVVDLVSFDSDVTRSVYDSANSTDGTFKTPNASRRTSRSLEPALLGSSTPYAPPHFRTRSCSNVDRSTRRSSIILDKSSMSSVSARRSKSLLTPKNQNISINVTNKSTRSSSASTRSKSLPTPVNQQINGKSTRSLISTKKSQSLSAPENQQITDKSTRSSASTRKSKSLSTPENQQITVKSTRSSASTRRSKSLSTAENQQITDKSTRSSASTRRSKSLSTPENQHISVNSTRVSRASKSRSRINDSDLQLLEDTDVDDSPKTSRRTRTKSCNTSRGDDSGPGPDGATTPEDRHSPVDVGTPVLSIQTLLDSSRSSVVGSPGQGKGRRSVNYKRKTIGVLSESRRSANKLIGASARQTVLRLSDDSNKTDENAPRNDPEDTITPKSAVKLVQEAVKNKHSTAKKPQSKRSIIDDLDQSDIVKQLFNSPVKRKLSQSITEFSRKHLFDEEEVSRRPTRHTLALPRTDHSLSEHSIAITPERFVSPIDTPNNSPSLRGIKRLFDENTPWNDLRNVSGVESLLRTQRTRKSTKNLSNVVGLKLFSKSPRNSLGDVKDKDMIRSGRKSDSRRISGVKSLFQRSPDNDLTDVRGVKKLFRRSPNNDLRNVSGVKTTLRKSPRNDLTDVRGVRNLFRERKKSSLHNVSGVEELFNTSSQSNSENLFDQLVGKPKIRSVYSKTFSTKLIQKPKNRHQKTFHKSLDTITRNPEGWLQAELQKRLQHKASINGTKELDKLMTATVDGEQPIQASRTRYSLAMKKSAADIYSAHTLPIKKRSIGERAGAQRRPEPPSEPPSEESVVHSTPVKGAPGAPGGLGLGRVSPIPGLAGRTGRNVILEESMRRKSKAKTPQKKPTPNKPATPPKATPKKSQAKPKPKTPEPSPNKEKTLSLGRVTRNRKNTSTDNIKKRRSSLVISKKTPVMSPEAGPAPSQGKGLPQVEIPKRTRGRGPKLTVVPGPSPPPRTTRASTKTKPSDNVPDAKLKRGPGAPALPSASAPRRTRRKQNVADDKQNITDNVQKPKRGRKALDNEVPAPSHAAKRRRGKLTEVEPKASEENKPKTRGKKVETQETVESPPKRRARTATVAAGASEEKRPKLRGKKVETEVSVQCEPTRRGRRANTPEPDQPKPRGKKLESEPKTRSNKVEMNSSVQPAPGARRRRAAGPDTLAPGTNTRKRKSTARDEAPAKVAKIATRGRNVQTTDGTTNGGKEEVPQSKTRGRGRGKAIDAEEKPRLTRATRGNKAAEPQSPVNKRKRGAKASPTKDVAPAPAAGRSRRR